MVTKWYIEFLPNNYTFPGSTCLPNHLQTKKTVAIFVCCAQPPRASKEGEDGEGQQNGEAGQTFGEEP